MEKKYYTYMVRCNDDSLYTGYTNDVKKRVETHNRGKGAKYTKARLPVKLVWYKEWENEHIARSNEVKIKKLKKEEKEKIINRKGNE